jgi:hypothetical protein
MFGRARIKCEEADWILAASDLLYVAWGWEEGVPPLQMVLEIIQIVCISGIWNQFGMADSSTDPLPWAIVNTFYASQRVTNWREDILPDVTMTRAGYTCSLCQSNNWHEIGLCLTRYTPPLMLYKTGVAQSLQWPDYVLDDGESESCCHKCQYVALLHSLLAGCGIRVLPMTKWSGKWLWPLVCLQWVLDSATAK